MWPLRTSGVNRVARHRARRVRKLRAAQRRGRACVTCGQRWPLPTVPTRINTPDGRQIGGYACLTCATSTTLALPPGGTT